MVDVSTLTKTIRELKSYNIDTKFATLDAGYLTDTNMRELYDGKVSFVSRLKENRRIYKTVAERESHDLEEKGNLVEYNSRYVYVKRVKVEVLNPNAEDRILGPDERPSEDAHAAYVYLCRDMLMKSLESGKLFASAKSRKLSPEDVHDGMGSQGIFMLISSRPIRKEDILSIYYMRQQIEQVFDLCKNNTKMLPLRVQSEETFRGHLLLSFAASVIVKHIQEKVRKTAMTPQGILTALRNQKCKVFDNNILTMEATRKANEAYKLFNITVPHEIPKKAGL
ncbi:MAG: transposase [Sphaerochaeta sp.]|nr:transposase [Sphaerochaeta sp.]